jgi:phage shock protein C
MKKTISINLGGRVFQIDDDAYEVLKSYLENLERHFAGTEEKQEIISDIESRIAEDFSNQKSGDVINESMVKNIIERIGTVEDIGGTETKNSSTNFSRSNDGTLPKRFFRNTDDAILGGVASGIAAYFGIDPLIPRILFVIFALTGGFSILIYIILWIIMPEAKTAEDRAQMHGKAFTLKDIENLAREGKYKAENFLKKK